MNHKLNAARMLARIYPKYAVGIPVLPLKTQILTAFARRVDLDEFLHYFRFCTVVTLPKRHVKGIKTPQPCKLGRAIGEEYNEEINS